MCECVCACTRVCVPVCVSACVLLYSALGFHIAWYTGVIKKIPPRPPTLPPTPADSHTYVICRNTGTRVLAENRLRQCVAVRGGLKKSLPPSAPLQSRDSHTYVLRLYIITGTRVRGYWQRIVSCSAGPDVIVADFVYILIRQRSTGFTSIKTALQ